MASRGLKFGTNSTKFIGTRYIDTQEEQLSIISTLDEFPVAIWQRIDSINQSPSPHLMMSIATPPQDTRIGNFLQNKSNLMRFTEQVLMDQDDEDSMESEENSSEESNNLMLFPFIKKESESVNPSEIGSFYLDNFGHIKRSVKPHHHNNLMSRNNTKQEINSKKGENKCTVRRSQTTDKRHIKNKQYEGQNFLDVPNQLSSVCKPNPY